MSLPRLNYREILLGLCGLLILAGCASLQKRGLIEVGLASWYGQKFQGKKTASGEFFDMNKMTAAHKTLPFGTRVRVRSLSTGKEITVRINDRGPFIPGRIIDLSHQAAAELQMIGKGEDRVEISIEARSPAAE